MSFIGGLRRLFGGGHASTAELSGDPGPRHSARESGALPRAAMQLPRTDPAEELRGAIERFAERMEGHAAREGAQLTEVRSALEPLSRMGDALGELRRSAITLNETFAEHAESARRASESSHSLLQRAGDSLVSQADVVAGMQQQVDGLVRTFASLGEDLDRLRSSLTEIAEHSGRSATSLAELVEEQARRDRELVRELRGFRVWTSGLLVALLLMMMVVLAGGAIVLLSLPRLFDQVVA
jgi:ABC-type transporter Mla subunit MlaD